MANRCLNFLRLCLGSARVKGDLASPITLLETCFLD